ncbi:MAG: TRAP transporter substrate-binding protein DctP [Deltaproteobacteria bacterium]|nr:TRAP transporter substrate-binding protein DctP [Deltaproteobacteria bacterium]
MKKALVIMATTLFVLSFLGADAHADRKHPWKIGHVRPKGTAIDRDTRNLVEKISKDTRGRITFEVYPGNKLGDYSVVQEKCSFGEVEMFIGPFGTTVDKKMALPFTPYLVTTWAEARKAFAPDGRMIKSMEAILEKHNIKILGGWPVYFGGIVLTREPPNPADPDVHKGMIIRTPPIRAFELTARSMGYTPYPITWAYAHPGLKTGMVEGMIGGGAEGYAGLKALAKVYLDVRDHFEYWFVYMNLDLWKGLSNNEKVIIRNAVREMESRRWDTAEAEEQASIKRLRDQGTKIITFSDAELAKTIANVRQAVWPEMKKDIGDPFDQLVAGIQK